jgi:Domain of unknown function (DUF4232)
MAQPGERRAMNDPRRIQERVRRHVRRRRILRRARTTSLVVLVAVVVGAAAYGAVRLADEVHKLVAGPSHRAASGASTTTSAPRATTTTATTAASTAKCDSPQLSASVYNWQIANGAAYEIISLTDVSQAPCALTGYSGVGVSGSSGTPLPAAVHPDASLGAANGSAPPAPVNLVPGARAWFEISFADNCYQFLQPNSAVPPTSAAPSSANAPSQCYQGAGLQVIPPQATSALLLVQPFKFTYSTAGLRVGPFEGSSPPSSPPLG